MARVFIPTGLRHLTGGASLVEIEARDVRGLIEALDRRFPGLGDRLRQGVSVAIDGDIVPDPLLEPVPPNAEIHFLPSISGGGGAAP